MYLVNMTNGRTPDQLAEYYFRVLVNGCKPEAVEAFKYEVADWANKIARFIYKYDINQINGYASPWSMNRYNELFQFVDNAFKLWKEGNTHLANFIGEEWDK